MKKLQYSVEVEEFDSDVDLPAEDLKLLKAAKKKLSSAYAPYSEFAVSAAVLLANGEIVTGTNQENAAYPSGMCAERVAVFSAASNFPGVAIEKVVITADSDRIKVDHPIAPCGACRQVMLEYEVNQANAITLVLAGASGRAYRIHGVSQMLPIFFHEEGLKKHL
ncbi:cytidine deaminase [Halocola ammonii]